MLNFRSAHQPDDCDTEAADTPVQNDEHDDGLLEGADGEAERSLASQKNDNLRKLRLREMRY